MSAMKRLVVLAAITTAAVTVSAAPAMIRLSTIAPTGTTWAKELESLAAAWKTATGGKTTVRLFPDGSQGDERSVLSKMRPDVDTIQAGLFTAGGLSTIDKGFSVFNIPFFFENDAEVIAVQKKLEPMLEKGLQAQGLHLVSWGSGGWIEIFSKKPIKDLASLRAAHLYVSPEDDVMMQWLTKNKFTPKQIAMADIGPQLKNPTGMIDTTPFNPYVAMTASIYVDANHMLDLRIAPLVGAVVVASRTWNAFDEAERTKMTDTARQMETRIRTQIAALDASSITAMRNKGLTVITPDPKALAEFRGAANDMAASLKGVVPNEIFQAASEERDRVRKGGK